jgi:DNA-binding LacI/PurR family transcriptional regulator
MEEVGLELREEYIGSVPREAIAAERERLSGLLQPPTALLASNDIVACGDIEIYANLKSVSRMSFLSSGWMMEFAASIIR